MLGLLILVRGYEVAAAAAAHDLPGNLAVIIVRGLADDFRVCAQLSIVLALPILALGLLSERAARLVHRSIIVVIVLVAVGLSRFFAITLIPLGADFWGYTAAELFETSAASSGGWISGLPFVIAAIGAWLVSGLPRRWEISPRATFALGAGTAVLAAAGGMLTPRPPQFADEVEYFIAIDKLGYFSGRSIRLAIEEASTPSVAFRQYPLLKAPTAEDILGPRLAPAGRPPNIVFIIVEGLGRDFVGAGAEYGGFTPFLDSLTTRSLYWENFLANSGRTFGVLPSLLGSLPFARGGFMSLGERMPAHFSLVRWLGEHGYTTNYFTGTNGAFDQIDVFMERQGVGRFLDQSGFPPTIAKQPGGSGGFTWGYGDRDMLGYSLEQLGTTAPEPRLDVYLTITTHEPFIPPNPESWRARFTERLASLVPPPGKRAVYEGNASVFSTLLYLDDALRFFFGEYAKRPEYSRTVFIITGDHRLIPIPFSSPLSRYHVPFIIASPLVKAPQNFASVSSHLDVTPTLAAYLSRNYGIPLPAAVPWLGSGIDSATAFRNVQSIPLMRSKNQLEDYLRGTKLIANDRLFEVGPGLAVQPVDDPAVADSLRRELAAFRQLNRFVTSGEHIYPETPAEVAERRNRVGDDSVFRSLDLGKLTPEGQFVRVQQLVETRDFAAARPALRHILRTRPSYHDARTLLARTYAWENRFDEARTILADVARRAPAYADGQLARIDVEIWDSVPALALRLIDSATVQHGRTAELLYARARALELMGQPARARVVLDSAIRLRGDLPGAAEVRARLMRPE